MWKHERPSRQSIICLRKYVVAVSHRRMWPEKLSVYIAQDYAQIRRRDSIVYLNVGSACVVIGRGWGLHVAIVEISMNNISKDSA